MTTGEGHAMSLNDEDRTLELSWTDGTVHSAFAACRVYLDGTLLDRVLRADAVTGRVAVSTCGWGGTAHEVKVGRVRVFSTDYWMYVEACRVARPEGWRV